MYGPNYLVFIPGHGSADVNRAKLLAQALRLSLPVDWSVGPKQVGSVSAQRSATNEELMNCASRIVAKSLMG